MTPQDSEESQNNQPETELTDIEMAEDANALKNALAEEKERAEGYLANWQRAQADFINYKRRSEQEKLEVTKFANSAIMLSLLPILAGIADGSSFRTLSQSLSEPILALRDGNLRPACGLLHKVTRRWYLDARRGSTRVEDEGLLRRAARTDQFLYVDE